MKFEMKSTNGLIVAMLAVAALAVAFWVLALGPKRDEAKKLGTQVSELKASLSQHRAEAAQAEAARQQFPVNYRQLIVLGKAVPADDETPSLLVQLDQIAKRTGVEFNDFTLEAASGETPPPPAPTPETSSATPTSNPASPTEVAASTLPLGAAVGPAGLYVMPYTLTFNGDFFHIADFIKGLDSMVKSKNEQVSVDGRLLTINGFSLAAGPNGFPSLQATFSVTTYLTPPNQGVTAGATPTSPAPATATPASTTTGGTP
ncbi:MAG: type 4a pilus biogenesis protein PilO [Solirubrobacterales bacterium]